MRFKKLNGRVENSSFISLDIEKGDNDNSIGDQMWISKDGSKMEISENADEDVLLETMNLFHGNSRRAFKGALMKMDVYF